MSSISKGGYNIVFVQHSRRRHLSRSPQMYYAKSNTNTTNFKKILKRVLTNREICVIILLVKKKGDKADIEIYYKVRW